MKRNLFWLTPAPLLAAILMVCGPSVLAQASGDQKPATRIQSDQLQHDDQAKVTVFSGNVTLLREGLTMSGDRLELSQRPDGSNTAMLVGKPARFSQQPRSSPGRVTGASSRMEFDSRTEVLVLVGNAQLRRTEGQRMLDEVVGDRIRYNSVSQTYEVQTQPGQGRAQMTLLPRDPEPARAPTPK